MAVTLLSMRLTLCLGSSPTEALPCGRRPRFDAVEAVELRNNSQGADMLVQRIGDGTGLPDKAEIPGLGVLPINAFVLHAEQPMLIDTGMPVNRAEFLDA